MIAYAFVRNCSIFRLAVGDLFTSLIHTCELSGTNPFE